MAINCFVYVKKKDNSSSFFNKISILKLVGIQQKILNLLK